mmetsp:Transcript_15067/g.38218  ORF Transcript_15067/g.38218 Transcript_15067/m.38218 type:complete len:205 (+) Transcript_15067:948-1562(+)
MLRARDGPRRHRVDGVEARVQAQRVVEPVVAGRVLHQVVSSEVDGAALGEQVQELGLAVAEVLLLLGEAHALGGGRHDGHVVGPLGLGLLQLGDHVRRDRLAPLHQRGWLNALDAAAGEGLQEALLVLRAVLLLRGGRHRRRARHPPGRGGPAAAPGVLGRGDASRLGRAARLHHPRVHHRSLDSLPLSLLARSSRSLARSTFH